MNIYLCCSHNLPTLNFNIFRKNLMGTPLNLKLNTTISLFWLIPLLAIYLVCFVKAFFGYCHVIYSLYLGLNETVVWSHDFIEDLINDDYFLNFPSKRWWLIILRWYDFFDSHWLELGPWCGFSLAFPQGSR